MLETRQLRYFVTLAEALHFGHAAERLHIVQPALSMQIRNLEQSLGTRLFERDTRGVRLNAAGRALLPEARAILERCEQAVSTVRDTVQGHRGTIRLAVSAAAIGSGVMARVIDHHQQGFPQHLVQVLEMHPASQRPALLAGEIDAALGPLVPAGRSEAGITSTTLASFPLLVAMPVRHPLASLQEISGRQLADETFIGLYADEDRSGMDMARVALGFEPRWRQIARTPMSLLGMVEAGLGIGIVSATLQRFSTPQVQFARLVDTTITLDVALIHHRGDVAPLLGHFIDSAIAVGRRMSLETAPRAP